MTDSAPRRTRPTSKLYTQAEADKMFADRLKDAQETELLATLKSGMADLKQLWITHTENGKHLTEGQGRMLAKLMERAQAGDGYVIRLTPKRVALFVVGAASFIAVLTTIAINVLKLRGS